LSITAHKYGKKHYLFNWSYFVGDILLPKKLKSYKNVSIISKVWQAIENNTKKIKILATRIKVWKRFLFQKKHLFKRNDLFQKSLFHYSS
jgi:hypothetical protein